MGRKTAQARDYTTVSKCVLLEAISYASGDEGTDSFRAEDIADSIAMPSQRLWKNIEVKGYNKDCATRDLDRLVEKGILDKTEEGIYSLGPNFDRAIDSRGDDECLHRAIERDDELPILGTLYSKQSRRPGHSKQPTGRGTR